MSVVWLTMLVLVPAKQWKRLWIAGIIGMLIVLPIDSTLISFGAFQFNFSGLKVLGLPVPYWISYIPGGILFAYFRPVDHWWRLFYILLGAFIFMVIEFIMIRFGFFQHLNNWNLFKAFVLNIGGFTILLWFAEWLNTVRKEIRAS